jgi:hypothetical protein
MRKTIVKLSLIALVAIGLASCMSSTKSVPEAGSEPVAVAPAAV